MLSEAAGRKMRGEVAGEKRWHKRAALLVVTGKRGVKSHVVAR
jgi:hypothetical protein